MNPPVLTRLRPAREEESATVLAWRNHPEVRKVMFTDHLISPEEHAAWWPRTRGNPDYRLLIIEYGDLPCGVVTFSRMADREACWLWGFYLNPDAFADGMDRLRAWNGMEQCSLEYAKTELACKTLCCEVFAFNTAVLAMHLRYRFKESGRYPRQRGGEALEVVQLERSIL